MGWERRRGREYYYQSIRENGRVRKKYLGNGTDARAVASQVESIRTSNADASSQIARLQSQLALPLDLLERLDQLCTLLSRAVLVIHGWRRINYAWRRPKLTLEKNPEQHHSGSGTKAPFFVPLLSSVSQMHEDDHPEVDVKDLHQLVRRAEPGCQLPLDELRSWIVDHPDVWCVGLHLANRGVREWNAVARGILGVTVEGFGKHPTDTLDGLLTQPPSALESLLAQVLKCNSIALHVVSLQECTSAVGNLRVPQYLSRIEQRIHRFFVNATWNFTVIREIQAS